MIEESRNSGAYQCAPRELALAVAHVEFGRNELTDGDPFRALHHLDEAELHAAAAAKRSDSLTCARPASDGPREELNPSALASSAVEHEVVRCRSGDSGPSSDESQGVCPNLQDNDSASTAESREGCDSEDGDSKGFRDRNKCVDGDIKSKERVKKDNQCLSVKGQTDNLVCLEKYINIEITKSMIRLKKPILFKDKQVKIDPVSYPALDEVARFLIKNPKISVEIQGHTDSVGDDTFNLDFSQKRAESVRDYLIKKGIAPTRLVARGYGETSPIESNRTSRGRAANRRIELIRID